MKIWSRSKHENQMKSWEFHWEGRDKELGILLPEVKQVLGCFEVSVIAPEY